MMDSYFKEVTLLIQNKKFSEAIISLNNLSDNAKKNPNYFFLKGLSYLYLGEINNSIENFTSTINLNKNNPTFYFYRGFAYSKINEFKKTIEDYKRAISLKPNTAEFYNNLAGIYYTIGENEKSIENYIKSIELNKNLKQPLNGLLNVLSQTQESKIEGSNLISAHNDLKKIQIQYSEDEFIDDLHVKKLLDDTNKAIDENIGHIEFDKVQTYREQQLPPHCDRHKQIFNKANIIPKHCFGCYKIQIEVANVVELIKLYIVFDKIKFQSNNSRKCMIELRPGVSGDYKGLIFSDSIEESNLIIKDLTHILKKNFNKDLKCKIKRGCSEYYVKYPDYNRIDDEAMKYNEKWEEYEKEFDEKNPDLIFDKKSNPTLEGISLFDAMVFRNWLAFAKMNGDESYKTISDQVFRSKFVEKHLELKQKKN